MWSKSKTVRGTLCLVPAFSLLSPEPGKLLTPGPVCADISSVTEGGHSRRHGAVTITAPVTTRRSNLGSDSTTKRAKTDSRPERDLDCSKRKIESSRV